jgi:hypothetical protein
MSMRECRVSRKQLFTVNLRLLQGDGFAYQWRWGRLYVWDLLADYHTYMCSQSFYCTSQN